MMLEINGAHVVNLVVMIIAALFGFWFRRMQSDQKESAIQITGLREDLARLREQLARETNDYARRQEIQEFMLRIETKIDRWAEKLDRKQDKP